jgi:hypothetical protein
MPARRPDTGADLAPPLAGERLGGQAVATRHVRQG